MVQQVKIIVEKHSDGYVAYPLGLKGVLTDETPVLEAFIAEMGIAI